MNHFDDLPKRANTHDTAEAAETAFRAAINAHNYFIIQREDRNDYGTDIQLEARNGNAMTNIRAHVQLKGTESTAKTNDSVSVSVARTNLNYLLAQHNSVYICYHLPSKRLLVRSAEDVYREYEHRGMNWFHQKEVTVNFTQLFDEEFQRSFSARLLASGKVSRNRRLQFAAASPEQILRLTQQPAPITSVPSDPALAKMLLNELYQAGYDAVISKSFEQFAALLDSLPGGMDLAYMAEINLGINGFSVNKGRVREGIQALKETMERGEFEVGTLLYCLGNAWFTLREYDKARDTYEAALLRLEEPALLGVMAQCSKNMGAVFEQLGKMEVARGFYEWALELDPDLCEARFALALWHRRNEDFLSALKHFDQVIRQKGSALQMPSVQGWRIESLFKTGNAEAAFREIFSLIGEANQLDWVWPWCARQVAANGRMAGESAEMALRFWRAYLREHPKDIHAEQERLLCHWYMHANDVPTEMNFTEFKSAMIQLIEKGGPDPAFLWDRIGHWAQDDDNWMEAEKAYCKAYALEPARYGYCFGTALNFLGRYSEALPILLPQAEEYPADAMSWFQVAVAREGVGDIAGSIEGYHRAIEIDIDYDLAWFNLGGMYWNSQDIERAIKVWSEAMTRFPDHELARKLREDLPFFSKPDHPPES